MVAIGMLGVTVGCTSDGSLPGGSSTDEGVDAPLPGVPPSAPGMAKDAGASQVDADSIPNQEPTASFVCTDPAQILWDCSSVADLQARAASLCNQGALQLKYDRDPACGGDPIAAWLSCCTEVGSTPRGPAYDAGAPQIEDAGVPAPGATDAGITSPGAKDAGAHDAGTTTSPRACNRYLLGDGTCTDLDELQLRAISACSAQNAMLTHYEVDEDVCAGGASELHFECCELPQGIGSPAPR